MPTVPIFDPKEAGRPMRVAGFMSGSGTNILRLIERRSFLRRGKGPLLLRLCSFSLIGPMGHVTEKASPATQAFLREL